MIGLLEDIGLWTLDFGHWTLDLPPTALIIRTAGTNCDHELAHGFELAGARPQTVHLNRLIREPALFERFDLIALPGGFSYGDDIAAGRILANRLRQHLLQPLQQAVQRGTPIIGICNGAQVLVKLGLLPDPTQPDQSLTFTHNTNGRFVDQWVGLQNQPQSPCVWTHGLGQFDLPIAHAEGRLTASESTIDRLEQNHQIALRYTNNPNGSKHDIAGLCDPTGLVLALMPHPERAIHPTHHPVWTLRQADPPAGRCLFENVVNHVSQASRP